jgi:hypothetical protein
MGDEMSNLIVILDPNYGDSFGKAAQFAPFWVVATPGNNDACQHLRETRPVADHREKGAVTNFHVCDAEDRFANLLDILPTLEEHHGHISDDRFSFPAGFILEVIGLSPTGSVTNALREFGFASFCETPGGFQARK